MCCKKIEAAAAEAAGAPEKGGAMPYGRLHSIETFGAVDGPGIRTVFFLQGCPARCIYCHNPDSWTVESNETITVEKAVHIAKRGKPYYGKEGGVTFSGGEPLMQGRFLIEAMDAMEKENINSVIDTSGTWIDEFTKEAIEKSRMLLLDIKHTDPNMFKKITGVGQERLLQIIDLANKAEKPVWIRQVIVPELNDTEENIYELKQFVKEKIKHPYKTELLGYHNMAIEKWDKLGIPYKLRDTLPMDKERLKKLAGKL